MSYGHNKEVLIEWELMNPKTVLSTIRKRETFQEALGSESKNKLRKSAKAGVGCKMRILLDLRDLINILEQRSQVSVADLDASLCRGNHQIVFCFSNIRDRSRFVLRRWWEALDKIEEAFTPRLAM